MFVYKTDKNIDMFVCSYAIFINIFTIFFVVLSSKTATEGLNYL